MPKMRFHEDKFVDGQLKYNHGEIYEVPTESVDRWLMRGGEIVVDEADDCEIMDQVDLSLAVELEKDKKIDHAELVDAIESDICADDDMDEALEVDETSKKQRGRPKKS